LLNTEILDDAYKAMVFYLELCGEDCYFKSLKMPHATGFKLTFTGMPKTYKKSPSGRRGLKTKTKVLFKID